MIELYKNISLDIIELLNKYEIDNNKLEYMIGKRQEVINGLKEADLEDFKKNYKSSDIVELDKKIKSILGEKIIEVRKEISSYKTKRVVNTIYVNMNKNNLNIFSRKV